MAAYTVVAALWLLRVLFHSLSIEVAYVTSFTVLGNIQKNALCKLERMPLGDVQRRQKRTLPEGGDAVIGESSGTLSGGERRRVSITRAMMKDAPIVILDGATINVPLETNRICCWPLRSLPWENYHYDRALPENRVIGRLDSGDQSGEDRAQGTYEELMPEEGI